AFRCPLLPKTLDHAGDDGGGLGVLRKAVGRREQVAFQICRRRIEVTNRSWIIHQAQRLFAIFQVEFIDVRERSGDVPSGPALDYRKAAETLFALFELS